MTAALRCWLIALIPVALVLPCAVVVPLWFDEIFTYQVAHTASFDQFWNALAHGPELNPSASYLLVRGSQVIFGDGHFGTRLPSVIASVLGVVALFCYVSARCRVEVAAMSVAMVIASIQWFSRAFEARPYAIVAAVTPAAFLFWSLGARGLHRRRSLICLSAVLGLAILSHCYSVLLFVPLASGELVRAISRRCIDWGMTAAILLPLPLTVTYIPLYRESRTLVKHTWASPDASRLAPTFTSAYGRVCWTVLIAILCLCCYEAVRRRRLRLPAAVSHVPVHEWVAGIVLLAMPVYGLILAMSATGFYTARYVMPWVIGLAIVTAFAFEKYGPKASRYGWITAGLLAGVTVVHAVGTCTNGQERLAGLRTAIPSCVARADADPVVISNGLEFLPILHYAALPDRSRMVYVTDEEPGRPITQSQSIDIGLIGLHRVVRLPLKSYREFVGGNRRFWLLATGDWELSWLAKKLAAEGARIGVDPGCSGPGVFRVSFGE